MVPRASDHICAASMEGFAAAPHAAIPILPAWLVEQLRRAIDAALRALESDIDGVVVVGR